MTKYFISPVLFAVITMACSSTTTTQSGCTTQECFDQLEGVAGSTSTSTKVNSSTGGSRVANGTSGNSTATKTTATSTIGGNSGTTTNTDIGGSTTSTDTGTGGSVVITTTGGTTNTDTGGSTTTSTDTGTGGSYVVTTTATGGNGTTTTEATGGSTTTSTCVPKTCADIATWDAIRSNLSKPTACGAATDGCGGLLSCGPCVTDGTANTDCGQAPQTVSGGADWSGAGDVPTPNVCGTRCVKNFGGAYSSDCAAGKEGWACPSSIPPTGLIGCVTLFKNAWCCDAA